MARGKIEMLSLAGRRAMRQDTREDRLGAAAQFVRVASRLQLAKELLSLESDLRRAELVVARLGTLADAAQKSMIARFLEKISAVVLGSRELEATSKALRTQLERLRNVEGPARLRLADEIAKLLGQSRKSETGDGGTKGAIEVEEMPARGTALDLELEAEGAPASATPKNGTSQGRASRSPFG